MNAQRFVTIFEFILLQYCCQVKLSGLVVFIMKMYFCHAHVSFIIFGIVF